MFRALIAIVLSNAMLSAQERVVVVDAETGERCGHAAIWAIPQDGPWRLVAGDPEMLQRERFAQHGLPLRADARGEVTLPDLAFAEVAALVGERWGQRTMPWPRLGTVVVEVHRDPVVELHLTGPDGAPTTVTATCHCLLPDGINRVGHLRLRGDAQTGIAQLRPLPLALAAHQNWFLQGRVDDGALVQVTLDILARDPIAVELDLGAPLPERVALRAPEFGSLRVKVTDEHGAGVDKGFAAAMVVDDAGRVSGPSVTRLVHDGSARFEAVALGARVRLQVSLEHRQPAMVLVNGPAAAGQEVVCEVVVPASRADRKVVHAVTGRLLDTHGVPLARCWFTAVVQRAGQPRQPPMATGVTEADGAFEVQLVDAFQAGDEVLLAIAGSGSASFARVVDRMVVRALQLRTERTQLDDLRCAVAPMLLAGRVVDTDGRPVDATLEVDMGTGNDLALPGSSRRTDRDGHFALHGAVMPKGPLRLRCRPSDRQESCEYEFAAGAVDLKIEVPARRSVHGRLVLPSARASRHLQIAMIPTAEADDPRCRPQPVATHVAADGSFATWPVAPGAYDLIVLLGQTFEVTRVGTIVVPAAGVIDDVRLGAIDLRAALREVRVRVEAQGRPIAAGTELFFARWDPALGEGSLELIEVVAAAREREQRLWLPRGEFTVQARRRNMPTPVAGNLTPRLAVMGDRFTVVLPR